jgi:hypothetical protein
VLIIASRNSEALLAYSLRLYSRKLFCIFCIKYLNYKKLQSLFETLYAFFAMNKETLMALDYVTLDDLKSLFFCYNGERVRALPFAFCQFWNLESGIYWNILV